MTKHQLVQHNIGPMIFSFLFQRIKATDESKFIDDFKEKLHRSTSGSLYLRKAFISEKLREAILDLEQDGSVLANLQILIR